MVSLDVDEVLDVSLPLENISNAVAVDTFSDTDSIFWTDKVKDTISTAKIDVSYRILLLGHTKSLWRDAWTDFLDIFILKRYWGVSTLF